MKKTLAFLLLTLVATLTAASAPKQISPEPLYPEIAKRMINQLGRHHLSGERFDDRLSAVAWTNLINNLDADRTLFTQEDLKKYAPKQSQIDDMIAAGDLSFGYDLMHLLRERLTARYTYVQEILARENPFDFSLEESYVWKRQKADRPLDAGEQKKLWHATLKNEYLALTLAKELDAEEKAAEEKAAKETGKPEGGAAEDAENGKPDYFDEDLNLPVAEILKKRYRAIHDNYVEMDSETVLQRYLSAIANAYDPHSDYMSPMNFEEFNMDMNLTLCGIGATLRYDDGAIRITELMPGAPAANDTRDIRLQEGDRIIGVGQEDGPIEDIRHKPLSRTVRKIRGPKGTKVVLRVIPVTDKSGTSTKIVDLIRDEIKLEQQAVTGHVERISYAPDTVRTYGYVRIPTFYAGTVSGNDLSGARSMTADLLKYIQDFNERYVDGLVIDLRNNGGGSLIEALKMTNLFVRGPVVQVRDARTVQLLPVQGPVAFVKPIVVLINRNSASASEIVASALQDYGRAILIGDSKSHGKGTVQTVQGLGDTRTYGADRITTACFYRINGGTTQLRGVVPDLVIPSIYDALELGEDQLPGALPYSTVAPAYYAKTTNLEPYLPQLKARSDARLAEDDQYQASRQLIEHIREANQAKTVSLNLTARRERMRADRAIQKLQEEALKGPDSKKDGPTIENDPLLREAFHVLSDFIELRGGPDEPMNTDGDIGRRLFRIFGAQ